MLSPQAAAAGIVLLFASSHLCAQVVEKYSASFSFPTVITSVQGHPVSPLRDAFFRSSGIASRKGIVNLEWSVPAADGQGRIGLYSPSGALVKVFVVGKNRGAVQCDVSRIGSGICLATLSYGSFRKNLTLAVCK